MRDVRLCSTRAGLKSALFRRVRWRAATRSREATASEHSEVRHNGATCSTMPSASEAANSMSLLAALRRWAPSAEAAPVSDAPAGTGYADSTSATPMSRNHRAWKRRYLVLTFVASLLTSQLQHRARAPRA